MKAFRQDVDLPVATTVGHDVTAVMDLSTLHGACPIFFAIEGTFSATYVPEISVDGEKWIDASKLFFDTSTGVLTTGITAGNTHLFTKQGLPLLRFRCSVFASQSVTPRVRILGQDSRSV